MGNLKISPKTLRRLFYVNYFLYSCGNFGFFLDILFGVGPKVMLQFICGTWSVALFILFLTERFLWTRLERTLKTALDNLKILDQKEKTKSMEELLKKNKR